MLYYLILFFIFFLTILSGCGFIPTFDDPYAKKYPDRPKALTTYQLLQTYVGKPVGAITPFLTKPQYKRSLGSGTQLEWGNSGLVWIPGNNLSQAKCELKIDVNNAGLITKIQYVDDYYSDQLRDCPQLGEIDNQNYIIQPDLYDYDKAHGILIPSYVVPK